MSYADVAGIDHIKGDIQEILDILLGDEDFKAMGAHPLRVSLNGKLKLKRQEESLLLSCLEGAGRVAARVWCVKDRDPGVKMRGLGEGTAGQGLLHLGRPSWLEIAVGWRPAGLNNGERQLIWWAGVQV